MKTMHFEIVIDADPERVWAAIVEVGPFEEWTSVFHEGSTFEGGWEKGSAIRFVAPEDNGERAGLVSEIAESRRPRAGRHARFHPGRPADDQAGNPPGRFRNRAGRRPAQDRSRLRGHHGPD